MIKLGGANIIYWIVGAVVLLIVSNLISYDLGHYFGEADGKAKVEVTQLAEQKKADDTHHKDFEKVDHGTPYTASRDDRFKWLLNNASGGI